MSEESILGIPNPLDVKPPTETRSSVSSALKAVRPKRHIQKRISYEEENSELVDDVDWEPPTQKPKISPKKIVETERPETATSSQDVDPLGGNAETTNEEPAERPNTDGPSYKDVRRKPQGTEDISETDDLIYCFDCLRDYAGECPVHGPLNVVKDTMIPTSIKDEFRARKTTPALVSVAYSKIPGAKTGVWACKAIPARTRFGPYDGKKVSPEEGTSYAWLIRKNGEPDHCIDASEPGLSNWMRFINSARHKGERNLQAFQYQGNIYYQTSRNVTPHEELLVWFGEENSRPQGEKSDTSPQKKPEEFKEAVFKCPACPYAYASPLYLARHTKYCRHLNAPKARKPLTNSANATSTPSAIDTSSSTVKVYPKEGSKNKGGNANQSANRAVATNNTASKASEKTSSAPKKAQTISSTEESSRLFVALKPYQCLECDERFSSPALRTTHQATVHPAKPFQCSECNESFFSQETLRNHIATHNNSNPLQCTECGECFSHEETLSSHMMTHAGENPLVCCVCSERFFDKEVYYTHLQSHSEEKPYACDVCQRRFARLDLAERHQSTHHSTTVYECPECPNKYNRQDTLQRHLLKHRGDHPYKCDKCDQQFIQKSHLTKHLGTHSPKGDFVCPTCNKCFGGKGALSTHQLTHLRSPYKCPICGRDYKTKCALAFHIKSFHQRSPNDFEITAETSEDAQSTESNAIPPYCGADTATTYGGSVLPDSYDEPEVDMSQVNIKREIEVSETKFLAVPENAFFSEVDESGTQDTPESDNPFSGDGELPLETIIKTEIDVSQPKANTQVDLSPHTIIKSEIEDTES